MKKKYMAVFSSEDDYNESLTNSEMGEYHIAYILNDDKVIFKNDSTISGITYVDLGLPSGTLWAKENVGVTDDSPYGLFFQWGDSEGWTAEQINNGKKDFKSDGSDYKISTFVDGVNSNYGSFWHIPSKEQCEELIENTTVEKVEINDKEVIKFKSKNNDNYLSFHNVICQDGSLIIGTYPLIWTNTNATDNNAYALCCENNSRAANTLSVSVDKKLKYNGTLLRGVFF